MNEDTMVTIPQPDMSVAELLEQCPPSASVFNGYGMACVGCQLSAFETLAEAARVYDVDLGQLLGELRLVIERCGMDHRAA